MGPTGEAGALASASEDCSGNIAKWRLLVNPQKLNFADFPGESDPNSEKGGVYEAPPDRYAPNSSSA